MSARPASAFDGDDEPGKHEARTAGLLGGRAALRRAALAVSLVAVSPVAVRSAVAGEAPPLSWDAAFPTTKARADVHFVAHFRGSDGETHRLEGWRHGTTFLRRRTDDTLELFVAATALDARELSYRFIDHRRHLVTDVHRSSLYRIGVFSDWFGLAHMLERPKTAFTVAATSSADANPLRDGARLGGCTWRLLAVPAADGPAREARICWSSVWALPLGIYQRGADGRWREQLGVDVVEVAAGSHKDWHLPPVPSGYGRLDADEDIAPAAHGDD